MAKKILVIGGTGFVGRNLFESNIYNLDGDVHYYFLSNKAKLPFDFSNLFLLNFNYFNESDLNYVFDNYEFSEVWHFLCSSVPSNSFDLIEYSIQNDLLYLIRVLKLMKEKSVRKLVFLSSGGAVYPDPIKMNWQEDNIGTPSNIYGILKTTMEHYIKHYHQFSGIDYMILRISNLFGPHHCSSNNGIINIAIRKCLKGEIINIVNNGALQKDFLFIKDFVKIYWALINDSKANNAIINVGSGQLLSINSILNIIKCKLPNIQINYLKGQTADIGLNDFSIDRLNSIVQIDFKDLESAIERTIQWEKLQFKKSNLN